MSFVALIAVARLFWLWRGWLDGEPALADDAFYYFQIARHVAQGLGPTFDGLAPTNGFHPLYLLILSGGGIASGRYRRGFPSTWR